MAREKTLKFMKLFQVAGVALAVYLVLKYLLPIVIPFVLAYFLCKLLYKPARFLSQKTRMPLGFWGSVLIIITAAVFFIALLFVGRYILMQFQQLLQNMDQIFEFLEMLLKQLCTQLEKWTGYRSSDINDLLCEIGSRIQTWLQVQLPDFVAQHGGNTIKGFAAFFVIVMIAFVGGILLIKNKQNIQYQLSHNIFAREITGLTRRIGEVAGCFFRAQLIIMLLVAVVCSVGLVLIGNPYGITIGIIIGVLDALPVIGSGTILLPWAVVLIFMDSYGHAAVLIVLFALTTLIREFLEARLMGKRLGINEFYMLMATFIGINLFGIWGIILGPLGMIMILEVLNQIDGGDNEEAAKKA